MITIYSKSFNLSYKFLVRCRLGGGACPGVNTNKKILALKPFYSCPVESMMFRNLPVEMLLFVAL